jgi:hypothetical protein
LCIHFAWRWGHDAPHPMKLLRSCLAPLLLLLLVVVSAQAAPPANPSTAMPDVVTRGFSAFLKDGTLAAIDTWLAGSAWETDDRFQDEAAERMNACLRVMGRAVGYEPVRTVTLSPSTRRVYAVVKFQKGVGWMAFDCYQPAQEWIVCRFSFHTVPSLILPPALLAGLEP